MNAPAQFLKNIEEVVERTLDGNKKNIEALGLTEVVASEIELNTMLPMQIVTYNTGLYTIIIDGSEVLLLAPKEYVDGYATMTLKDRCSDDLIYLTKFNKVINITKNVVVSNQEQVKEIVHNHFLSLFLDEKIASNRFLEGEIVTMPSKNFDSYVNIVVSDDQPYIEEEVELNIIEK